MIDLTVGFTSLLKRNENRLELAWVGTRDGKVNCFGSTVTACCVVVVVGMVWYCTFRLKNNSTYIPYHTVASGNREYVRCRYGRYLP